MRLGIIEANVNYLKKNPSFPVASEILPLTLKRQETVLKNNKELLNHFKDTILDKEKDDIYLLFKRIMDALYVLHLNQQQTLREMRAISAMVVSNGSKNYLQNTLAEKFELNLPLNTIEEFNTMDKLLENNPSFKSEFKQSILCLLDANNILTRTLTNILKMYLSRDVVLQFNALRKNNKKGLVFRETKTCKCILDIVTRIYKQKSLPLTEKDFYKFLGPVITNAIDWDGHRALRIIKNKKGKQLENGNADENNNYFSEL